MTHPVSKQAVMFGVLLNSLMPPLGDIMTTYVFRVIPQQVTFLTATCSKFVMAHIEHSVHLRSFRL